MKKFYHNNTNIRKTAFLLLILTFVAGMTSLATAGSRIVPAIESDPQKLSCQFGTEINGLDVTVYTLNPSDMTHATVYFGDGVMQDTLVTSFVADTILQTTHSYATPGEYRICFTISNGSQNCSECQDIIVSIPNAPDCEASFTYQQSSVDNLFYIFTSDSKAESYTWSIDGEQVSTDSAFSHRFMESRAYSITLSLNYLNGENCTKTQEVNTSKTSACNAAFGYDTDTDSVAFDFYALHPADAFEWMIGGQVVSTDSAFTYMLTPEQIVEVKLSVNIASQLCETTQQIKTKSDILCNASFNYNVSAFDELTYFFIAHSSATEYRWFINGQYVSGDSSFFYQFDELAAFDVSLSIIDQNGNSCSSDQQIEPEVNKPCDASFVYYIDQTDSLLLTFTPEADYRYLSYEWKIDGNLVSTDSVFTYQFPTNGQYTVSLTVHISTEESCSEEQNVMVLKNFDRTYSIAGSLFADVFPINGGNISIYSEANGTWDLVREVGTSDGDFYVNGLPEGKYLLYARGNQEEHAAFIPTYFVNGISWSDAYHLELKDSVEGVKITLIRSEILSTAGSGALQGRLSEVDQKRPSVVLLKDQASKKVMKWTVTDEDNQFAFEELPYGNYEITAEIPGGSFSQSVSITESRSQVTDIDMSPGVINSADEWLSANQLKVYPTRFTDYVSIENKGVGQESYQVEIFTMTGKIIHSESITLSGQESIRVYPLTESKGLMIMKIRKANGQVIVNRLIRE